MRTSTVGRLTGLKYVATLLGAVAVLAVVPATAHAADNEPATGGGASCTHTDADGNSIPLDNGQDVFVDGKIVSCRNGKITVTTPPQRANSVRPQIDITKIPLLARP